MSQQQLTSGYVLRRLPVHHKQEVLVDDQDLNDIIKSIKHYHKLHTTQYDGISDAAWKGDAETTARHLFDFCKKYIRYHVEPEYNQTIKSPGRLIEEGFGDCKHYASLINGIVDSLERKGFPISCCYRFVSDIPGKDVHHVFAVIRTKNGEFWVDPVLSSFDQRPTFHNTKDIAFSHGIGRLSYLSGTDAEMGAHGRGRAKFKHALQSIKKGVNKAAQDVKHVALKVGAGVGRNAVLALLDINAFNLASRVKNSHNPAGLKKAWKNIGGDPNKLLQAARNGLLFQAKLHHKNPRSVHGYSCAGMGAIVHTDHITTHPKRWIHEHYMRKHRRHRMRDGLHHTSLVAGSMVGIEPVSTASLMALASGILAILGKFLGKADQQHEVAMADAAKEGTAAIVDQVAQADQAEGNAKADRLQAVTTPSGGADASMSVKAGVDAQGQPQVQVDDVRHPALQQAGQPGGGAAAEVAAPSRPGQPAADQQDDANPNPGFMASIEDKVKTAWRDHKMLIILGTAGVVLFKSPKLQKKFGMR